MPQINGVMRRYDLDWLRVIVFGLLILYHVGMFFVPWGWHIKNNDLYSWVTYPMLFLNQWRLPILFVISGMGTYYALNKRTGKQFVKERIVRLFIPLAFGMLFIVPPQVYVERLVKGQFGDSYFTFWPANAFIGVYPEGNLSWHHLWFLPYLLTFSLILVPLFLYLRRNPENSFLRWTGKQIKNPLGMLWFLIPLYLCESLLEPFFPVTHALIGDWFTFINYMFLFSYGFILISVRKTFWENVKTYRKHYLLSGIVGFIILLGFRMIFEDSTTVHFIEAGLKVLNLWAWILTIFGYAAKYLNQNSKVLRYSNEAVYPFYILHQTITIILGYWLMNSNLGLGSKFGIMAVGTFGFSWLIYEFGIRRWSYIRPLFGLKKPK